MWACTHAKSWNLQLLYGGQCGSEAQTDDDIKWNSHLTLVGVGLRFMSRLDFPDPWEWKMTRKWISLNMLHVKRKTGLTVVALCLPYIFACCVNFVLFQWDEGSYYCCSCWSSQVSSYVVLTFQFIQWVVNNLKIYVRLQRKVLPLE